MAKKKKKKVTTPDEKFKNGMYIERTKQAAFQGGMLLVFLCGLAVFSYIVSMIPAGIFGVAIAKNSTTDQGVYDFQNIALTVLGIAIISIGGWMLSKKCGENDALYAFQNKQERTMDMRYLWVTMAIGIVAYFILAALMDISFIAGPIRYLGIFLTRHERSINEGIKVNVGLRSIASVVCIGIEFIGVFIGIRQGFKQKMNDLEKEEEEEKRKAAERAAEAEAETQN